MYTIEKTFEFDLAHRIHNQNLDDKFTENKNPILKCRRFHGHTAQLKIKLGADELADDMVLDYNEIGFIKKMIDDVLDHKTLISTYDPLYEKVVKRIYMDYSESGTLCITPTWWRCSYLTIDDYITDPDIREFISSFTLVQFTTSSENIANWIAGVVNEHIDLYNSRNHTDVKLISVSYKETPKSEAVYMPRKP